MSLLNEIKLAENTPTDYKFIHSIASPVVKNLGVVYHEKLPEKPSLHDIFGSHDAVCILFRLLHHDRPTPVAHWCCLFRGKKGLVFFDSLAINLKGIYRITHESRKLEHALKGHKYEHSHTPLQKMVSKQKYCGCAVAVRLRYYKTKTNAEFERFIINHDRTHPGETLATLCLFHYTDQHEYEISDDDK
jgi:hypothetical protein